LLTACRSELCQRFYYYYCYAAFNAPCVGHKDDESQAIKNKKKRLENKKNVKNVKNVTKIKNVKNVFTSMKQIIYGIKI